MKELGQLLKDKRLEQKLHIEKVAQDLRIRHQYLSKIEEGDFSLENVYMVGYVKNYALYLKVDIKDYLKNPGDSYKDREKLYQDDESSENSQPDSTTPPIMVVAVAIAVIIISIALLVLLNNFNWLRNTYVSATGSSEQYSSSANKPEIHKINSFHIEILNIEKNDEIIITANTKVELSVFGEDGSLDTRERLEAGQSVSFYGKHRTLKLITNVANAITISFKN